MWLHHSMFTCSQDCLSITFQSIHGMIYIMTLLSIWLLFSVMPPKSHPLIIEVSDEGFYDRRPSEEMSFVASLRSKVVVKFRCEEEEVLEKSLHQLRYWLTIEFFSSLSKWKHIYQAKVLTVSALTFWSTRKMKTWSQTLPVVETQPQPTDVKIILNNRQMIPLISFGTSEENLKWF